MLCCYLVVRPSIPSSSNQILQKQIARDLLQGKLDREKGILSSHNTANNVILEVKDCLIPDMANYLAQAPSIRFYR